MRLQEKSMGSTAHHPPTASPIVENEIIPALERLIELAKADGKPFLAYLLDLALIEARHGGRK